MTDVAIRKIITRVEETCAEAGRSLDAPTRKVAVVAVIANPFAGRYVEDIMPMMEALKPLGLEMTRRLVALLGGRDKIDENRSAGCLRSIALRCSTPIPAIRPRCAARILRGTRVVARSLRNAGTYRCGATPRAPVIHH